MADEALTYLASLPPPTLIEELSHDAIDMARRAELLTRFAAAGVPYDVSTIETDSGVIQVQEASFREVGLRARGNDIVRGRYRLFAGGSDLDHLAEYYNVRRMDGELDERLNYRITLAQQGQSVAGPEAYWMRLAMAASVRVADVAVWREPVLPILHLAILAADNGGIADPGLLALVEGAVTADTVRPMSTKHIVVESATRQLTPVTANVKLLPGTAPTLLDTLKAGLPAAWATVGGLGRDLTADWLKAALMAAGVYSVEIITPAAGVMASEHEMVRIGNVTLNDAGRGY
jgi:phage-related baseplate assembly protein